jgi:hypothetical protein
MDFKLKLKPTRNEIIKRRGSYTSSYIIKFAIAVKKQTINLFLLKIIKLIYENSNNNHQYSLFYYIIRSLFITEYLQFFAY